jgi:carbon-monoxide dehydrogenase medium subunit
MQTELAGDEVLTAVRIPRFSKAARFGFHKICRKTGEFAEAIGVVVDDPEQGVFRLVAGATDGKPIIVGAPPVAHRAGLSLQMARALLQSGPFAGPYDLNLHAAALKRACDEAYAP